MTYKNFEVKELADGSWLAQVEVLTPKKYRLQYTSKEEKVARESILNYLKSQNATEEV